MALRQKPNFWLFAVDANPELRYNRIIKRNSETDQISFDTFLENEAREMNSDDPNKQNLAACQQLADYNFDNNNSFNELYSQIEKAVYDISK